MTTELSEREKTLRIVRFFLPRLRRQELANEIEDEKNRLRQESIAHIEGIRSEAEATIQKISREKEDYADRTSRRISDLRRDAEDRIRQETSKLHSQLKEHDQKKTRDMMIIVASILAVVVGVALTAGLKREFGETGLFFPIFFIVIGLITLIWSGTDCWRVANKADACRKEIESRETSIRKEMRLNDFACDIFFINGPYFYS